MEGEEERVMNVGGDWFVFVVTKEWSAGGRQDGATRSRQKSPGAPTDRRWEVSQDRRQLPCYYDLL